jgi:hypothetical protein
MARSEAAR